MKFSGINNSFYSQYLKANVDLVDKLCNIREYMQEKTLGISRWKQISSKRNQMSKSSSFIDLFDVLKLFALKTGVKRNFLAISRHLILQGEKRKQCRKMEQYHHHNSAAMTEFSNAAGTDLHMAGYSEPMQRWLKDKLSTTVQTYHPIYRSYSCDYEDQDQLEKWEDGTLKSINDDTGQSVAESSVKSEMSRLERKLNRQNSIGSKKNSGGGASKNDATISAGASAKTSKTSSVIETKMKTKRESVETTKNVSLGVVPYESDGNSESDDDVQEFVDHNFGMIGTPYRRQSRHDSAGKGQKRYSL